MQCRLTCVSIQTFSLASVAVQAVTLIFSFLEIIVIPFKWSFAPVAKFHSNSITSESPSKPACYLVSFLFSFIGFNLYFPTLWGPYILTLNRKPNCPFYYIFPKFLKSSSGWWSLWINFSLTNRRPKSTNEFKKMCWQRSGYSFLWNGMEYWTWCVLKLFYNMHLYYKKKILDSIIIKLIKKELLFLYKIFAN